MQQRNWRAPVPLGEVTTRNLPLTPSKASRTAAGAKPASRRIRTTASKAATSNPHLQKMDSVRKQTTGAMSSIAGKALKAGKATLKEIDAMVGSLLGQDGTKGKRRSSFVGLYDQ